MKQEKWKFPNGYYPSHTELVTISNNNDVLENIIINTIETFAPIHPEHLFRQIKERSPETKKYEILNILNRLLFKGKIHQDFKEGIYLNI